MLSVIAASGDVTDAGGYIDVIIDHIRHTLHDEGLEHLILPDITSGRVFLSDGQLFGLASLKRKGDARVTHTSQGVTVEASLCIQQVRLVYDYSTRVFYVRNRGGICVCVGEIETHMKILQPSDINKSPVLQKFVVRRLEGLRASHSGLGPLSWMANHVQRVVLFKFREHIQEVLSTKMHALIQEELNKFALSEVCMTDIIGWQQGMTQR